MSQHDRALDCAVAYHAHVFRGLITSDDHLQAAELAADVADAEYLRAAQALAPNEQRMFLSAADRARRTRDGHTLAAEITTIGEGVLNPPSPDGRT